MKTIQKMIYMASLYKENITVIQKTTLYVHEVLIVCQYLISSCSVQQVTIYQTFNHI